MQGLEEREAIITTDRPAGRCPPDDARRLGVRGYLHRRVPHRIVEQRDSLTSLEPERAATPTRGSEASEPRDISQSSSEFMLGDNSVPRRKSPAAVI